MNTATKALNDASFRSFAIRITEFSAVTVYDFADGSALYVHDSGRTATEYRA